MEALPKKYKILWKKCLPLLKKGRPGDDQHAEETVKLILNYKGKINIDQEILIPVAMMHDIGHSAILPKHFKYVTGPEKIVNGKLVHMLSGAKIANDLLKSIKYDRKKTEEIVEIISIHDFDRLVSMPKKDFHKIYNTKNKKIFHDIDSLDRYTEKRVTRFSALYKNKKKLLKILEGLLDNMFFGEFKKIAKNNLKSLIR